MRLFVDVILPLAVPVYTYTFETDAAIPLQEGMRVEVPLGKSKTYIGVVLRIATCGKEGLNYRDIVRIVDTKPIATAAQLALWQWISSYYMCTLGEVMTAALPSPIERAVYKAPQQVMVRLTGHNLPKYAGKQQALYNKLQQAGGTMSKEALLQDCSASSYTNLLNKGVLEAYSCVIPKQPWADFKAQLPAFTDAQQQAYQQVLEGFAQHKPVLLHGVTSSGKTIIYQQLIADCLQSGKQALLLVPEIALSAQLVMRLQEVFGQRLLLYHSRLSDMARSAAYMDILERGEACVVVGVRSAVFLPFTQLGLVVVDEEHDPSYKQTEPAPRYHARNVAVLMAKQQNASVVLGSATPSIETYVCATQHKYHLVQLLQRYGDVLLPRIELVDRGKAFRQNRMKGMFSWRMVEAMQEAFEQGRQVILFQNRRGYAHELSCPSCAWVPKCPKCDVSLSYHALRHRLVCHYCEYSQALPAQCPSCGNKELLQHGCGTEKVEEQLHQLFPKLRSLRMDIDSTQKKQAVADLLASFAAGEADVLIGTQMVAKGLDFPNVAVTGILNADNLLSFPDFRTNERAYQLLLQVAGRCGRSGQQGMVIVQTAQIEHPMFAKLLDTPYAQFVASQLRLRYDFNYPPYCRLIEIWLKSADEPSLVKASDSLAAQMREQWGSRVLGPESPAVGKVQNKYLRKLLFKIDPSLNLDHTKQSLQQMINQIRLRHFKVLVVPDVDPV